MTTPPSLLDKALTRARGIFARNTNVILLLVAAAILTYCLCLPNQMFWDDDDFILKNLFIQDWKYWPNFFTKNVLAGNHLLSNYWRPLLQATFAVEWHLWTDWVYGWHAVSIAVHTAAAIMLFYVLNTLLANRTLAILAALLWLVHPAHTEAVVYPNSLGDSMATFFILAGIFLYARFRRAGVRAPGSSAWWLALLMYPLALLSKETGILLVAFIALADFFFLTPQDVFLKKAGRVLAALWPFIVMACVYILLRATVLNFNNSFNFYHEDTPFTTHFGMRLAAFFRAIALYAGFIFTPYDLRVERLVTPPASFLVPDVLWGITLCATLAGLAALNWNKRPAVAFGALWAFTGILPTCNLFVIINALVYEHFLYSAMIGIILIVLLIANDRAVTERQRRTFIACVLGVACIFGVRSAWRCLDWRTAIKFYEQLAVTAPTSYRVINNLGMSYANAGLVDKAAITYRRAIDLDPTNAVAYHNLGNIYRDAGQWALAEANYEKAISTQPNFIFSYKSLAQVLLNQENYGEARRVLEQYYQMCDEKPYILDLLVKIAYREGAYADAKRYLATQLQMKPGDPATIKALEDIATLEKAKPAGKRALQKPDRQ